MTKQQQLIINLLGVGYELIITDAGARLKSGISVYKTTTQAAWKLLEDGKILRDNRKSSTGRNVFKLAE